jgi:hypothetical protein
MREKPGTRKARSGSKQLFKSERGLRTETTFNDPIDFGLSMALHTLSGSRDHGQRINARLLNVKRVADGDILRLTSFDRLQEPTLAPAGVARTPRVRARCSVSLSDYPDLRY